MKPAAYAKAIAGAVTAAATAAVSALADGHITAAEAGGILLAAVVAGGAVFGVPNRK